MSLASELKPSRAAPLAVGKMLVVVLSVVIVLPLAVAGTSVLLPPIARDLGAEPGPLQWVVNGFNLSFAASTLVWGAVADRFGLRRTFFVNAAVFAAGSVGSAVAPSVLALDFFRVFAGAGAGAIQVTVAALISTTLSGTMRARAFGMLGTVLGVGLAFGPTISGAMSSMWGWRSVFLLPLLPLALACVMRGSLPPDRARVRLEVGTLNAAEAAGARVWGVRNPRFLALCTVTVVQSVAFITLLTYLPTAFSAVWGMSEGEAGVRMLILTLPVLLLPALASRIVVRSARVTAFGVIYAALSCAVVGNVILLFAVRPAGSPWALLAGMVLLGASFGLPLGLIDGEALACAPRSEQGRAAGVLNFVRISSEALAVAAYGALLAAVISGVADDGAVAARVITGAPDRPGWYADAFQYCQLGIIALSLLLSLAILQLHARSRRA